MIGVALGHMALALGSVLPGLETLAPGGLPGMIGAPWGPPQPERHAAFWSSLGSFAGAQALWGLWVLAAAREGRRPPRGTGLGLLALTVLQLTLAPVSGFWLNLVPALLLMAAEAQAPVTPPEAVS
ncbi:hypothetical protein C8263_03565 [Deinococcus arcticus]|uniref:Uncharacterized protein n=1 Tax=Deinococcus arcticus TaxID=2136176 RepID=A0A2T3WBY4_9DEIO|nr:hypothetical protein C8263_03565 [Deinococcus arcticus]